MLTQMAYYNGVMIFLVKNGRRYSDKTPAKNDRFTIYNILVGKCGPPIR